MSGFWLASAMPKREGRAPRGRSSMQRETVTAASVDVTAGRKQMQ